MAQTIGQMRVGTALAMAWLMVALVTAAPNGNQVEAEVESPDGTIAAKNFSQAQLEQLVQRESNGDPTLTQVDPCNSYDGCARCAEDRRCGWCVLQQLATPRANRRRARRRSRWPCRIGSRSGRPRPQSR